MTGHPLPGADARERLACWIAGQLPGAGEVRLEGVSRVDFGHSADMITVTARWSGDGGEERADLVIRMRPPAPGLLEPYDLQRQFRALRALASTAVRAPRARWLEPTGGVLGRPFLVMDRVAGQVYERTAPEGLADDPQRLRRMCLAMADQLAAIHAVDLPACGLDSLGDGRDFLTRELDRWGGEMARVARGPLPALERLLAELRDRQPEQSARRTLLHGDMKPGNVAFTGERISAIFDWELVDVGDPLTDLGYLELLWGMPVGLTGVPGAPTTDELVARYEELSGIPVRHRGWYRAMQAFKVAVISLLGSMLFDAGHSDDLRHAQLGYGVPVLTGVGLAALGVDEELEPGPVTPRRKRIDAVRAGAMSGRGKE